jgi:DNA-directed RNA polymerase subunit P
VCVGLGMSEFNNNNNENNTEANYYDNSSSQASSSHVDMMGDASGTMTEKFEVIYSCLRCNTTVSNADLVKLPEIKCICGFRVFTKVRPPVVKQVKAV